MRLWAWDARSGFRFAPSHTLDPVTKSLARLKGEAEDYRLFAVRAHLLEILGRASAAREAYEAAAMRTGNLAQQRYLRARAARA